MKHTTSGDQEYGPWDRWDSRTTGRTLPPAMDIIIMPLNELIERGRIPESDRDQYKELGFIDI